MDRIIFAVDVGRDSRAQVDEFEQHLTKRRVDAPVRSVVGGCEVVESNPVAVVVVGLVVPEVVDCSCEQPQRASSSLELGDRIDLFGERIDDCRMERVLAFQPVDEASVRRLLRELSVTTSVVLEVRLRKRLGLGIVDTLEEPVLENLSYLVLGGRSDCLMLSASDLIELIDKLSDLFRLVSKGSVCNTVYNRDFVYLRGCL